MEIYIISPLFFLSLFLNVFLFMKYRRARKSPAPDKSAKQLLGELLTGPALIEVRVVDTNDIMIRSPHR